MSLELKIKAVIGFNGIIVHLIFVLNSLKIFKFLLGKVQRALHITPCGKYILYPLGCFIVLKNIVTQKEAFLDGHKNDISCIALSHDGNIIASGQTHLMGVKVS